MNRLAATAALACLLARSRRSASISRAGSYPFGFQRAAPCAARFSLRPSWKSVETHENFTRRRRGREKVKKRRAGRSGLASAPSIHPSSSLPLSVPLRLASPREKSLPPTWCRPTFPRPHNRSADCEIFARRGPKPSTPAAAGRIMRVEVLCLEFWVHRHAGTIRHAPPLLHAPGPPDDRAVDRRGGVAGMPRGRRAGGGRTAADASRMPARRNSGGTVPNFVRRNWDCPLCCAVPLPNVCGNVPILTSTLTVTRSASSTNGPRPSTSIPATAWSSCPPRRRLRIGNRGAFVAMAVAAAGW